MTASSPPFSAVAAAASGKAAGQTVLIVDDHALFRRGLQLIVQGMPDVGRVLEAASVMQACAHALAVNGQQPAVVDVVLLDIAMPGVNGLDGIAVMRRSFQQAKVLVISGNEPIEAGAQARKRGADGFLPKTAAPDEMARAIAALVQGQRYFGGVLATGAEPVQTQTQLPARQLQVLALVAQGKSNKLIARELGVSENTVRTHLQHLFDTLRASSRMEAVLAAQRLGLLSETAAERSPVPRLYV